MNAVQFIEDLRKNHPNIVKADEAFSIFKSRLPEVECTYGYFRTKFNNKLKEENIITNNSTNIGNFIENIVVKKSNPFSKKGKRIVTNYNNGDSIPEPGKQISTGTKFDELISDDITTEEELKEYLELYGEPMPANLRKYGGFTRKCADIIAGKPGSGKTVTRALLAVYAKRFMKKTFNEDIRVGFICVEMRRVEWGRELAKSPILNELEVDYMLDYVGCENYEEILWEALADYDLVILDSFPAVLAHLRMLPSEKRSEKEIIFDFINKILSSVEENNNNVQIINQANKDGSYKGGTELPHMLSSMSYAVLDGTSRYTEFEKNRNNGTTCGRRLYSYRDKKGDLIFDEETYDITYKYTNDKKDNVLDVLNSFKSKKEENDKKDNFVPDQKTIINNIENELIEISNKGGSFGNSSGLNRILTENPRKSEDFDRQLEAALPENINENS